MSGPGIEGGARDESGEVVATIAPPPEEHSASKIDPAALHGPIGDAVRLIEPHSEADPVAILTTLLAGIGNLIGGTPHLRVGRTRHPPRLYVWHVGATSVGRKGTAVEDARFVFEFLDPTWTRERVRHGLISGEGLIYHVRDTPPDVEPIDRRLLVIESEMAAVLAAMGRQGSTLSPVMRTFWDSGFASTLAKNEPVKASNAHLSIVAQITEAELLRFLSSVEMANGFINRFLMFRVRRSKLLPIPGHPDPADVDIVLDRLFRAVDATRRIGTVTWSPQGKDRWIEAYPELTRDRPGMIGALTARGAPQVTRLALLYAILDGKASIGVEHLDAAWAVWKVAEESVTAVFANRTGDPLADRIGEILQAAPVQVYEPSWTDDDQTPQERRELSRTQLREKLGHSVSAQRLDDAIHALELLGLVEERREPTAGRPSILCRWIGPA